MFRPEYPRPQMIRPDWINLNGAWEYQTDYMASGTDRKLYEVNANFTETIEVSVIKNNGKYKCFICKSVKLNTKILIFKGFYFYRYQKRKCKTS